jgi:uncharacterized ubiquitin-like protein YukD
METLEFEGLNFSKVVVDEESTQNYKAVGYAYSVSDGYGDADSNIECEIDIDDYIEESIIHFAHFGTKCNHCGKKVKYLIIVQNEDDKTIHVVGSKCGETISQFGMYANRLAGKSALSMKMAKQKKNRKLFLSKYVGLEEALYIENNPTIKKIRENFVKYNKISEKQVEFVLKLAEKQKVINETCQSVDFSKLENEELEVVSLKGHESRFGMVTKILLKSEKGFKLYGNLNSKDIEVGNIVLFSSNQIEKSRDDAKFGFFKRAKIVKK